MELSISNSQTSSGSSVKELQSCHKLCYDPTVRLLAFDLPGPGDFESN